MSDRNFEGAGASAVKAPAPVIQAKLDELREMGGDEFVTEVVGTFLTDARERIGLIVGSLANRDVGVITREAHALKSAAASVGAEGLRTLATTIEAAGRLGECVRADIGQALATEFERVAEWFAQK